MSGSASAARRRYEAYCARTEPLPPLAWLHLAERLDACAAALPVDHRAGLRDRADDARARGQRAEQREAQIAAGPLGTTGQVYVTYAAAQDYAARADLQIEEARRELTELLLDATARAAEPGRPEPWRLRSRTAGLDISARVVTHGRLRVVVSISVREYNRSGRPR